jgi:UDP-N-acetylglucosamine 2-epimerase (non-hydrolysing)
MRGPIAVVFGTRPEIIKLAPVIRALHAKKEPYFMLHTGQHYSYEMDRVFFRDLELPDPEVQLAVKSGGRHGEHTGRMLEAVEDVLLERRPSVVLVQGDTNSVLAGALAAAKIGGMRLGHVEAGLRSYDREMPEETNRIVADHLSDYLFPPTDLCRQTLLREGIDASKIHMTGNTIVDAVFQNLRIAKKKSSIARPSGDYYLMTLHRQENVDRREVLAAIFEGVSRVLRRHPAPLLFSVHPRTLARLKRFGLKVPKGIELLKPVGFLDFLTLEEGARLVLSDSGGVQEETCILRVPCVTLRTSTERPETVTAGGNVIAGHRPADIEKAAERMLRVERKWKNPFGDGKSAERIVRVAVRAK